MKIINKNECKLVELSTEINASSIMNVNEFLSHTPANF